MARDLSVSHLAGFMATVHWTTSFLAWVECTDRGFGLSSGKYNHWRRILLNMSFHDQLRFAFRNF